MITNMLEKLYLERTVLLGWSHECCPAEPSLFTRCSAMLWLLWFLFFSSDTKRQPLTEAFQHTSPGLCGALSKDMNVHHSQESSWFVRALSLKGQVLPHSWLQWPLTFWKDDSLQRSACVQTWNDLCEAKRIVKRKLWHYLLNPISFKTSMLLLLFFLHRK